MTVNNPSSSFVKWTNCGEQESLKAGCSSDPGICLPIINGDGLNIQIQVVGDNTAEGNLIQHSDFTLYSCTDCETTSGGNESMEPSEATYIEGDTTNVLLFNQVLNSLLTMELEECSRLCLKITKPAYYPYRSNADPIDRDSAIAIKIDGVTYNFATPVSCTGVPATDWAAIQAAFATLVDATCIGYSYTASHEVINSLSTGKDYQIKISRGISTVWITFSEQSVVAGSETMLAYSNCFIKIDDDCNTSLLKYRCREDAFGMYYSESGLTTFYNKIRIPIAFNNMQQLDDTSGYSKSNGETIIVSAIYKEQWDFDTDLLYKDWCRALAQALKSDELYITNGYTGWDEQGAVCLEKIEISYPMEPDYSLGHCKSKIQLTPYDVRNSNCG